MKKKDEIIRIKAENSKISNKEIATMLDLKDVGYVRKTLKRYGNGKPVMKASKTKQAKPKKEEPLVQPFENGQAKYKVDFCKKYIARKIAGTTDIKILNLAFNEKLNTLLIGDTGTGKTHAIRYLAKTLKIPYVRVNLDRMVTVEDLVGEYKPKEGGGFEWCDGILTKFVKHGGIFVCDEINASPAEIMFVLHSLLDDDRQIILRQKDGEVIKAHKNFWFVATMNPEYEGTKPMNEALKDRFHVILNYDYDKKLDRKLVGNEKLIELAERLRKMYFSREIETPCSTRALIQHEWNEKRFDKKLAKELFVNRYSLIERKAVREVFELVLEEKAEQKEEGENDDAN